VLGEAVKDSSPEGDGSRKCGRQTLPQAPQATHRAGVNSSVRTISPFHFNAPVEQTLAQAPQAVQVPWPRKVMEIIPFGTAPAAFSVFKCSAKRICLRTVWPPRDDVFAGRGISLFFKSPRKPLRESEISFSRREEALSLDHMLVVNGFSGASDDCAKTALACSRTSAKRLPPSPSRQAEQFPVMNETVFREWSQRAKSISSPRLERQPGTGNSLRPHCPALGQRKTGAPWAVDSARRRYRIPEV